MMSGWSASGWPSRDGRKGFLLDGYPRTARPGGDARPAARGRGDAAGRGAALQVPEEELVARLSGRRVCRELRANYHVTLSPPRVAGRCDACGGELYQRTDDEEATVRRRLRRVRARHPAPRGLLPAARPPGDDLRQPARWTRSTTTSSRRPRARGDRAEVARPDRPHARGRPDPGRRLPSVPRPGEAGRVDPRDRPRSGEPHPGAGRRSRPSRGTGAIPATICARSTRRSSTGSRGAAPASGRRHHRDRLGVISRGTTATRRVTLPVGEVTDEARRLLRRHARRPCDLAIAQCWPGRRLGTVGGGAAARGERTGFGVVREFSGHGIGRALHEDPQVPNFGEPGSGPMLEPGWCWPSSRWSTRGTGRCA